MTRLMSLFRYAALAVIVAVPAVASAAPSLVVDPSVGLGGGASATASINAPIATAGTAQQELVTQWDPSQASFPGGAVAPQGWTWWRKGRSSSLSPPRRLR
ncbi:MAG: hypothetical protein ACOYL4_08315 [Miltoncostaeaceae bacterium]